MSSMHYGSYNVHYTGKLTHVTHFEPKDLVAFLSLYNIAICNRKSYIIIKYSSTNIMNICYTPEQKQSSPAGFDIGSQSYTCL